MTVRVGVIGVGTIGQDHIRRLTRSVSGAQVVALSDVDAARAETVAGEVLGTRVFRNGQDLVRANEVDAVLVAADHQLLARGQAEFFAQGGGDHHPAVWADLGAKVRLHAGFSFCCRITSNVDTYYPHCQ